jgi:predicted nucleotidyltransferase
VYLLHSSRGKHSDQLIRQYWGGLYSPEVTESGSSFISHRDAFTDRTGSPSGSEDDEPRSSSPVEDIVAVDVDVLRSVLENHPVSFALLFGSQVDGTADAESDVDLVVELTDGADQTESFFSLLTDITVALDRNDVDLTLLSDLAPRVGRRAFEHGIVLVGTEERASNLEREFASKAEDPPSKRTLRERLDAAIERVDEHVDGEAC